MPKLPNRKVANRLSPGSGTEHPTRLAESVPASSGEQLAATGTLTSEPGRATASAGICSDVDPSRGILGYNPAHRVSRKKTKPCTDCELAPKKQGHPLWCPDCWLRRQPISVQVAESRRRLARIPIEDHRPKVPDCPPGRRWCAGCQHPRPTADFADGHARCRPCVSDAAHRTHLDRTFGQGAATTYDTLFKLQRGRCAICGQQQRTKRLAQDHDHKTEQLRGLLCQRCNHELLGSVHDSLRLLEAAVYYLRNPPADGRWSPDVRDDPPPF